VPILAEISNCPIVLVIAGHDPGGAGIQADIETASALGCRALTLVTCLTTQNSRRVQAILPTEADLLLAQADCLLEDIAAPSACKLGLIPTPGVLQAVLRIIESLPAGTPIIVDPVLGATAGGPLSSGEMPERIRRELLPLATLSTPNQKEFRKLCGSSGLQEPIPELVGEWCLITGADVPDDTITHQLFGRGLLYAEFHWPRLDGVFHGSGCTLATAAASFIARGETIPAAVAHAQSYTWEALRTGIDTGATQFLPSRPPG
jgi:hydroxymethylpyrimidine/phosphomethylpyrimidine kinase